MKKIFIFLFVLMSISNSAFAFDVPKFKCNRSNIPEGRVTYRLSSESERIVKSRSCVRAGTKLTVEGKVLNRSNDFQNLDLQFLFVNYKSGEYRSSVPTINSDGTFRFVITTPKHLGPTGDPSPQRVGVSVTDPQLAVDIPNFPYDGLCEMRERPSRNVSFRACVQR
jgi:hypothetical protein